MVYEEYRTLNFIMNTKDYQIIMIGWLRQAGRVGKLSDIWEDRDNWRE